MGTETVSGPDAYNRMQGAWPRRMCLGAVANAYYPDPLTSDRPGYYQNADIARDAVPEFLRSTDRNIPLGAAVYFNGNHIAISGGGDVIRSTDANGIDGEIGTTTIAGIENQWDDVTFSFWATWICGHPITVEWPPAPTPDIPGTYTVQTGDSLTSIGEKFGVNWSAIYDLNRLTVTDPNLIYAGQVLAVPQAGTPTRTYTVQTGDSLSTIADKYPESSVTWQTIFDANRETVNDANVIYVGQVLNIPN